MRRMQQSVVCALDLQLSLTRSCREGIRLFLCQESVIVFCKQTDLGCFSQVRACKRKQTNNVTYRAYSLVHFHIEGDENRTFVFDVLIGWARVVEVYYSYRRVWRHRAS